MGRADRLRSTQISLEPRSLNEICLTSLRPSALPTSYVISIFLRGLLLTEEVWTVRGILEWIEGYLGRHGDENPRVSAQWLVSEALELSRMQLFLDLDRPLTLEERDTLRDYTRRRGAGEPLQYITGKTAFRHIEVQVRRGVLIPRPETEVLVSEALALLPAPGKPQDAFDAALLRQLEGDDAAVESEDETPLELLVADICTGSGCIACSIAYEHPATRVVATDISPVAVELAADNARMLELDDRVDVVECDLGEGVDPALMGAFDLVVSNPPYVPSGVLADIPREVADFEPALALDGGDDGLDVFRRLLAWCSRALKPGGGLAFELHETCLDEAAREAADAGFADVRIVRDLADRPRVLTARKSENATKGTVPFYEIL